LAEVANYDGVVAYYLKPVSSPIECLSGMHICPGPSGFFVPIEQASYPQPWVGFGFAIRRSTGVRRDSICVLASEIKFSFDAMRSNGHQPQLYSQGLIIPLSRPARL